MAGRQKKSSMSPPALGGSSLLVVFAVLSLTVFALLSLSTVRADQRLGEASARAVTAYYAADAQAQEILARLRLGELPEGVAVNGRRYSYRCPISETQALEVELEADGQGGFTVLRWQAAATVEWEGTDDIEVWQGS